MKFALILFPENRIPSRARANLNCRMISRGTIPHPLFVFPGIRPRIGAPTGDAFLSVLDSRWAPQLQGK